MTVCSFAVIFRIQIYKISNKTGVGGKRVVLLWFLDKYRATFAVEIVLL